MKPLFIIVLTFIIIGYSFPLDEDIFLINMIFKNAGNDKDLIIYKNDAFIDKMYLRTKYVINFDKLARINNIWKYNLDKYNKEVFYTFYKYMDNICIEYNKKIENPIIWKTESVQKYILDEKMNITKYAPDNIEDAVEIVRYEYSKKGKLNKIYLINYDEIEFVYDYNNILKYISRHTSSSIEKFIVSYDRSGRIRNIYKTVNVRIEYFGDKEIMRTCYTIDYP